MPKEVFGRDFAFLPREQLLTFEEITRLARAFVGEGVSKVRLTGGEPLLRRDLEQLITMLAGIDGITDVALTTNGSALAAKANTLKDAGLTRVTVSLDALDDETFAAMNDVSFPVARVLAGIDAAATAGLTPVKINMVVKRGINDGSIVDMAEHFRGTGHILRLIEYMDVGATNGWRMDDVVAAAEIIATINQRWPVEPVKPTTPARSPAVTDTATEPARSGSLPRSHSPSAAPAREHAFRRTASSTPACSPHTATICGASCAMGQATRSSQAKYGRSGPAAPTATQNSGAHTPSRARRSRCPTSAAERPPLV